MPQLRELRFQSPRIMDVLFDQKKVIQIINNWVNLSEKDAIHYGILICSISYESMERGISSSKLNYGSVASTSILSPYIRKYLLNLIRIQQINIKYINSRYKLRRSIDLTDFGFSYSLVILALLMVAFTYVYAILIRSVRRRRNKIIFELLENTFNNIERVILNYEGNQDRTIENDPGLIQYRRMISKLYGFSKYLYFVDLIKQSIKFRSEHQVPVPLAGISGPLRAINPFDKNMDDFIWHLNKDLKSLSLSDLNEIYQSVFPLNGDLA